MGRYIVRRLLVAVPIILLITVIVFMLMQAAPYDAIDAMTTPRMSQEQIEAIRARYGYDQPVWVQYFSWLGGILTGNFGFSISSTSTKALSETGTSAGWYQVAEAPEPTSGLLMLVGLGALALRRRRS